MENLSSGGGGAGPKGEPCFKGRTEFSRDDWETPPYFYNILDKEFHFTLDPCASDENHKCQKYYTIKENGLKQSWAGETVFINPPFSEKDAWIKKCWEEINFVDNPAKTVVMIIPATTDTKSWHYYVMQADEVRFCFGRVNFKYPLADGKKRNGSNFPLAIVIFRKRNQDYLKVTTYLHKPFQV